MLQRFTQFSNTRPFSLEINVTKLVHHDVWIWSVATDHDHITKKTYIFLKKTAWNSPKNSTHVTITIYKHEYILPSQYFIILVRLCFAIGLLSGEVSKDFFFFVMICYYCHQEPMIFVALLPGYWGETASLHEGLSQRPPDLLPFVDQTRFPQCPANKISTVFWLKCSVRTYSIPCDKRNLTIATIE